MAAKEELVSAGMSPFSYQYQVVGLENIYKQATVNGLNKFYYIFICLFMYVCVRNTIERL